MEKEIRRLLKVLETLDPLSEEYGLIISRIDFLFFVDSKLEAFEHVGCLKEEPEEETMEIEEPVPMAEVPKKKTKKPAAEKAPQEEVSNVVSNPEPVSLAKTAETISYEEMRSWLSAASNAGVQINEIIKKNVPEGKEVKFSNVPPERYPDIMAELDNMGVEDAR